MAHVVLVPRTGIVPMADGGDKIPRRVGPAWNGEQSAHSQEAVTSEGRAQETTPFYDIPQVLVTSSHYSPTLFWT